MKYIISIIITILLIGTVCFFGTQTQSNSEYLRIHIRANSNINVDQAVKYQVKDAVVDFLIPYLANCQTKSQSIEVIENNLTNIENVAKHILLQNNFSYSAKAKINFEQFPTRNYGDLTLESGFYDALILELGSGMGDNWWCVVYPPLCFVNGSSTVSTFKSRIIEILNSLGIKV